MQGDGGFLYAGDDFLRKLRALTEKYGILLICDEIQTGFGRTGKFFGHQHFGIRPDVITMAKGLASGFPLSGIAASAELMAKAWPGSQGGTYGGNAVACAAALATLEVIESENLVDNAAARGRELLAGVRAAESKAVGDVRGLGLLVGSEFCTPDGAPDRASATAAQQLAADKGLLLLTCGAYMNVVRMIPPLIVTENQITDALAIWSDVLAEIGAKH